MVMLPASLGLYRTANHPISCCLRAGRSASAPRFASPMAAESALAKLAFSSGPRKLRDRELLAARDQKQPHQAEFLVRFAVEPRPQRIERPFRDLAAMA